VKLEAWAVGITAGSREVPGRKSLWQEISVSYNKNNNNNNNNNNNWFMILDEISNYWKAKTQLVAVYSSNHTRRQTACCAMWSRRYERLQWGSVWRHFSRRKEILPFKRSTYTCYGISLQIPDLLYFLSDRRY